MSRKRVILLSLSATVLLAGFFTLPALLTGRLKSALSSYGLEGVSIGGVNYQQGDVIFSDIKFDKDGFNNISLLKAKPQWHHAFSARNFFDDVVIDRLQVTLDATQPLALTGAIAAYLPPLLKLDADNFRINSVRIDMNTAEGALALQAKAAMMRQEDGIKSLDGVLWGNQYQLTLDTRWDARIESEDKWKLGADIRDLRANLGNISLSRGNGWLNLEADKSAFPVVSGQIAAGQIKIGKQTVLGNTGITLDGSVDNAHIIIGGTTGEKQDVSLTIDMMRKNSRLEIQATAETKKAESLLSFLQSFHADLRDSALDAPGLTNLLITPGNPSRIRQEIKKVKYDSLTLAITGTWQDMSGKIIAVKKEKKGVATHIISLDPNG